MIIPLFIFLFFFITNRYWIASFWEGFTKGKPHTQDIHDPKILRSIQQKTGLRLRKIKLLDTQTTWGMMAGIPGMPYMVISKDAYENLTKDELQWLFLHEAGHYVLRHNIKSVFVQGALLAIGVGTLIMAPHIFLAMLLAIAGSAVYPQIARQFEYQANAFAVTRMDHPEKLKTLYTKAKKRWKKRGIFKDTVFHRLFNIWNLDIYKDLMKSLP